LSVGLRASDSLDTLRIEKKLNLNGQPSTVVGHTQQMQIEFSWHFAVLGVMFNFLDDANETGMLLINPQVATAHAKGHAAKPRDPWCERIHTNWRHHHHQVKDAVKLAELAVVASPLARLCAQSVDCRNQKMWRSDVQ
jgi:hypothetical protein